MSTIIVVILLAVIVFLITVIVKRDNQISDYQNYVVFLEGNLEDIHYNANPGTLTIYTADKVKTKEYMQPRSNVRDATYTRTDSICTRLREDEHNVNKIKQLEADHLILVKEVGVLNQKLFESEFTNELQKQETHFEELPDQNPH